MTCDDEQVEELEVALARMPLFRDLRPESRQGLAQRLTRHPATRGDVVFREGSNGDTLHVILAGAVKIAMAAPDNRETVLAVLGTGDVFG